MAEITNKTKFHYQGYLYHVVLSFHDEETFFVVKWWGKHKQWWHYEVMSHETLMLVLKYDKLDK
ncbi:MAG: hypothetical protein WCQ87_03525 [Parabacteroides sp.]